MATKIKIRIDFECGEMQVDCSDNGRRLDMTHPQNIANVAGMLAMTSVEMTKEIRRKNIKKDETYDR